MYPLQLTIDVLDTTTPQKFHIEQNAHIPRPQPPIDHRFMEYHYTKYISYIAQCTYTHGRLTPPPPPIKHRSPENHYTK